MVNQGKTALGRLRQEAQKLVSAYKHQECIQGIALPVQQILLYLLYHLAYDDFLLRHHPLLALVDDV